MDRTVRDTARRWLEQGHAAVVVEVTQALGSAPREAGTRMLVSTAPGVATTGTIGGGHLELLAIARAHQMLNAGETRPYRQNIALGPSLGQCCGGAVTLDFRPLDAEALAGWPAPIPRFELQLFGAGHVGQAIATLLATLDVSVDWIDEREDQFPPATTLGTPWPPHIRRVCVDAVESEVRLARPGAFYLVLTHDHDLDLRITEAVLRRGDFAYLGLIGSQTKRQRFLHRFEQRGIDAAAIGRMTCPIGAPGIEGKSPEVLAVAVVAQLLALGP